MEQYGISPHSFFRKANESKYKHFSFCADQRNRFSADLCSYLIISLNAHMALRCWVTKTCTCFSLFDNLPRKNLVRTKLFYRLTVTDNVSILWPNIIFLGKSLDYLKWVNTTSSCPKHTSTKSKLWQRKSLRWPICNFVSYMKFQVRLGHFLMKQYKT